MSAAEEEALAVDVAEAWESLKEDWRVEKVRLKRFKLHRTRPSHLREERDGPRYVEDLDGLSASDGYAEAMRIGVIIRSMIDTSVDYEERLKEADWCIRMCNELARDSVEYVTKTKPDLIKRALDVNTGRASGKGRSLLPLLDDCKACEAVEDLTEAVIHYQNFLVKNRPRGMSFHSRAT